MINQVKFTGGRILEGLLQIIKAAVVHLPNDRCDKAVVANLASAELDEIQDRWLQFQAHKEQGAKD